MIGIIHIYNMNKTDLEILANLIIDGLADRIIDEVANRIFEKFGPPPKERVPNMVDSNEAARILGISRRYLLQIKERFNYVKVGNSKQSRIYFPKEELYKEFEVNNK